MHANLLILLGISVHLLLAAAARFFLRRQHHYSTAQVVAQSLLALLIPILGALIVILVARESVAQPQKPDTSGFDPLRIPSGE